MTNNIHFEKDALYYEYTTAVNPLHQGNIKPVPYAEFLSHLHEEGST